VASGELHALAPLVAEDAPRGVVSSSADAAPAAAEGAAPALSELAALVSSGMPAAAGGSKLGAAFGLGASTSTTREALDRLTQGADLEEAADLPAVPGGALDTDGTPTSSGSHGKALGMGWEARAIDAWLGQQLSSVPSHLLPPVTTIFTHTVHHALRPATHLKESGGVSELRRLARARALRDGSADSLKAVVAELTPLFQRRFAMAGGAKSVARRLRLAAKARSGGGGSASAGRPKSAHAVAMEVEEGGEEDVGGGGDEAGAAADAAMESADESGDDAADGGDGGDGGASSGAGGKRRRKRGKKGRGGATSQPTDAAGGALLAPGGWMGQEGWAPLDLGGLESVDAAEAPLVRNLASAPPPQWVASASAASASSSSGWARGAGALSAADAAFLAAEAYSADDVERMASLLLAQGTGAAPASGAGAGLGGNGGFGGIGFGGSLASVALPGSRGGASLAEELSEAVAALDASGLRADAELGLGLAPLERQRAALAVALADSAMDGSEAADWQDSPTKGEWKTLAKLYAQRRKAGESAESLSVLAEGLCASGVKAARLIVEEQEAEAKA
jgi:hypothetical protein